MGLLGLHFFHFGLLGFHFLSFWPFRLSFPFILALWASFAFVLAFWAFISFQFGLLDLHFLSFFGLRGLPRGAPPHKLPKTDRFVIKFKQILSAVRPAVFSNFWPFGLSFPFHFGLLGFHFLSFWPFGPSFLFILAFWAFISVHFCLPGLPREVPPTSCQKRALSESNLNKIYQRLSFPIFGLLGFHFLSFWRFGLSFPFIGLLGLHLLSFWPFGPSFLFILAFWAFICFHFGLLGFIAFHFGLLGLYFLPFWPLKRSKRHLTRIWPKIAIFLFQFPLNFAIFPFQKCAVLGLHFGLLGFLGFFWGSLRRGRIGHEVEAVHLNGNVPIRKKTIDNLPNNIPSTP